MITWQTGQGDSEILLVRGDTFIYRVNDTLYSARIQGTSVGTPQLLAQDEPIPDTTGRSLPGSNFVPEQVIEAADWPAFPFR